MTWPVARDVATRSLDGLCFYALQGVADPGPYWFGIRPREDDDSRPLVFEMPASAEAELQTAAKFREEGILAIFVPVRALLDEFCARATAELGITVTPMDILACRIASTGEGS
ncbi:MAG: hypothetical protein GEU87_01370 [Alphaproteobacteria bacterium]|nr:hypothetical protein [Alphaproteobacteria bacterium]